VLEVIFYEDDRGRCAGLSARGHVELGTYGKDVVCAAVSGILQAARLGLTEYANVDVEARQQPGELQLRFGEDERDLESVRAIVATAQLAIEQIARQYPKHVGVKRATARIHQKERGSERTTSP
jgi:uncharacterized protein